jgi:Tfp pilus assembly protein PilF
VARHGGDLDRAERAYREVIETYLRLGARQTGVARVNLALVLCRRERYPEAREVMEQARADALSAGHDNLAAMVDVFVLEVLAGCGDWAAFTPALGRAESVLGEALMVDPDLATSAEHAADLAERAGHIDQARRARALAAAQWERLGQPVRASSLRTR